MRLPEGCAAKLARLWRHLTLAALAFSASASWVLTVPAEPAAQPQKGAGFEVVSEHVLPSELEWASDFRWLSSEEVAVTNVFSGVYRWNYSKPAPPQKLVSRGSRSSEIWLPFSLASSGDHLAVAAPFHAYGWRRLSSEQASLEKVYPMAAISDLDLHGNQLVILGAQRDGERFAPDGAIGWLGSLDSEPTTLRPVLFSSSGPGAKSMDACGMMDLGSVRFLGDGSFVVVPGVEPGVYHFDAAGQMLRTWSSEELDFDAQCSLSEEDIGRLSTNENERSAWVNQRRTVDEILPLSGGPGLLIRSVEAGQTRWQLKILRKDGRINTLTLPVSSPSAFAHLKGDVRGDRVLLLVRMMGFSEETPHPEKAPRLVVLRDRGL